MIERGDVKRVLSGKSYRRGKTSRRIAVVTKNKFSVNPDAMPPQIGQRPVEAAPHGVEHLVHVLEVFRIQTPEANEHALATAACQQLEELGVVRRINAGLANQVARLEPVISPGKVFWSDAIYTPSMAESPDEFTFRPKGEITLPKNFGKHHAFELC
jgi:hypothetical protein